MSTEPEDIIARAFGESTGDNPSVWDKESARAAEALRKAGLLVTPGEWRLPSEPGPEVTAVRCTCHSLRWDRTDRITAACESLWQAEHHEPGFGWPTWRDLLANHDKIVDATTEAQP